MDVLIIEDEQLAVNALKKELLQIDQTIKFQAILSNVEESIAWLQNNTADLIFMDIHLSDGNSFEIFKHVSVNIPVIFVTAFDQYAIKAFKVNAIDYILKPIDGNELKNAINKSKHKLSESKINNLLSTINQPKKEYQKRFLVKKGGTFASISEDKISYFAADGKYVCLITKTGAKYFVDYTMFALEKVLDPKYFFRLNRSYITRIDSIEKITALSKSKVHVVLNPPSADHISVSTSNTRLLKMWLNK